ncbi:MAG TPA: GntR family transcriptional regulator [Hyphomicrobiales bacterium]|jgi:DNA-binding GntR family transcriptional regulator
MKTSTNSPDAITAIMHSRSQSLTAIVYDELERRILKGEIKAGDRFNEQSLANALGVSRGPVREARRSLEKAGLVVSSPGRGTFVRQIDPAELAENYDLRAMLTGFACARLAEASTTRQRAALSAFVERMDAAIAAEDETTYYALNVEFHAALMAHAKHRAAERIYQDLVKESHLSRQMSLARPPKMRESNAEHAEMLQAIAVKDVERARRAGEAHVLNGKVRWRDAVSLAANEEAPRAGDRRKIRGGKPGKTA